MPESWASTSSKARRTSSASPASHAIASTLRPSTSRTAAAFDRAARRVVAAMSSGRSRVDRGLQDTRQRGDGFQPLAAAFADAVGARVLDHEACGPGKRSDESLVLFGELSASDFSVR